MIMNSALQLDGWNNWNRMWLCIERIPLAVQYIYYVIYQWV